MGKRPKHCFPVSPPTRKQARPGAIPKDQKQVRGAEAEPIYEKLVSWHLGTMDLDGPSPWPSTDRSALIPPDILSRLRAFESMTWGEVLALGGKQNHFMACKKLCPAAQERLRTIELDDHERLMSLRKDGPARIWGTMRGPVMNILWWDPDHQVFPVGKNHT